MKRPALFFLKISKALRAGGFYNSFKGPLRFSDRLKKPAESAKPPRFLRLSAAAICFSALALSCSPQTGIIISSKLNSKAGKQEEPQRDYRKKSSQLLCPPGGKLCEGFPACISFCNELFISKENQRLCRLWPVSLYEKFERLYQNIKEARFASLEPQAFGCFLKRSPRPEILFKDLSREEAVDFLAEAAINEELAFYLDEEDEERRLLRSLLEKINERGILALKEEMPEEHENLLIAISRYENPGAFSWIDNYIVRRCEARSRCREPLEYYCDVLEDVSESDLEDFFENQDFKADYKSSIEKKRCGSGPCSYGSADDFERICKSL